MTYIVMAGRNIGNAPDFVVATTKRYNGALSERDNYAESVAENQRKHFPDARVVIGPVEGDTIAVVTILDGGEIVETVSIVGQRPPTPTCGVRNCRLSMAGHRRAVEHIENEVGPQAAHGFEVKHNMEEVDD